MHASIKADYGLRVVNGLGTEARDVGGRLLDEVMPMLSRTGGTQSSHECGVRAEALARDGRTRPCGSCRAVSPTLSCANNWRACKACPHTSSALDA